MTRMICKRVCRCSFVYLSFGICRAETNL